MLVISNCFVNCNLQYWKQVPGNNFITMSLVNGNLNHKLFILLWI